MTALPTLAEIRTRWNDVLDTLERRDRITWLAFFDARLASFEGGVLTLDFSDVNKFAAKHEYKTTREKERIALVEAIHQILGIEVTIQELA